MTIGFPHDIHATPNSIYPFYLIHVNVSFFLNILHLKGTCSPKDPTKIIMNLQKVTKYRPV